MPPVEKGQIRPRRAWYWVAAVLGVAAIAGSVLIFTSGDDDLGSLTDVFGTLEELDASGSATVDLRAGDEWAVYRNVADPSDTLFEDEGSSSGCRVRGPDGNLVPVSTDFGLSNVTLGDEVYAADYSWEASETGSYEVACDLDAGGEQLLVGEKVEIGEIFGFFGRFAAGIAVLLLGLLATVAIALPIWLIRSRKIGEARRAGALRD